MKKTICSLLVIVVFVAMLTISKASASGVSVSFSGQQNVKSGQEYKYTYHVDMNQCRSYSIIFNCNTAISGDTKIFFQQSSPYENTDHTQEGELFVSIDKSMKAGDTVTITVSGKYTIAQGSDLPDSCYKVAGSYTLTVISSEEPTPLPSAAPTEEPVAPAPATPTPLPSQEPTVTPTPKAASHSSDKPINSAIASDLSDKLPEVTPAYEIAFTAPSPTHYTNAWDALRLQLDTIEQGGSITYSADPSAGPLPAHMLNALKAKEALIVINFDYYSCTIDGKKLGASITDPVSLSVDMTKTAELSVSSDGQDIYQFHLSETGELPGCFSYCFEATNNQPGDTLYLYHYHSVSGLAEYKQSVCVNANCLAAFEVYEGGSYFVTASPLTDNPKTGENETDRNTSSDSNIGLTVALICIAIAAVTLYVLMRHHKLSQKVNHNRRD